MSGRRIKRGPDRYRWLAAIALVASPLVVVLAFGPSRETGVRPLPVGYAALASGLMLELVWLTGRPGTVARMSLVALGGSLLAFLPFKGETHYSSQAHVEVWPIFFSGILIFQAMLGLRKKLVAPLGEGSTLLHSIVFFYWMLDEWAHGAGHLAWVLVASGPLLFTGLHAWTPIPLTRPVRLAMSLWSSIVMGALAVQATHTLIGARGSVEDFLAARDPEGGLLAFLGYFLLGTGSAYIATNLDMLIGYLPDRRSFFNREYFRRVRELTDEHLARFSSEHVSRSRATLAALAAAMLLVAHWFLPLVPTRFVVWLILTIVPWALLGWASMRARVAPVLLAET